MVDSVQVRLREEIRDLHGFFVGWFRGELPATREAFARAERALGSGFRMITPRGALVDRDSLVQSLWSAHASIKDRFEIEVRNVRTPERIQDPAIGGVATWWVVYEEWQWRGLEQSARLSSACLDEAADGTWTWRYVHETWMPDLSASK